MATNIDEGSVGQDNDMRPVVCLHHGLKGYTLLMWTDVREGNGPVVCVAVVVLLLLCIVLGEDIEKSYHH